MNTAFARPATLPAVVLEPAVRASPRADPPVVPTVPTAMAALEHRVDPIAGDRQTGTVARWGWVWST
ncbi:MAG TPA: hypothetical protein VH482_35490 [Thermomicrobiales bacterium]|jgi:hypothetical protein